MAGAKPRRGEAESLPATTFGYIHPRRLSGGGNVEIGNIDFQGLWEGWKKQSHRFFQAFQQTVISTACFRPLLRLVHASVECAQLAALLSGTGSRFFLASSIR